MYGGRGNDTYWVDSAGDETNENAAPSDGVDNVFASISFSLTSQPIENLTLIGSDNLYGIGNALANTLVGNGGNNILNGLAGADWLSGVAGSDRYYVDEAGDVVDESMAGSNGVDTVNSYITFNLANTKVVHGAVEDLVLLGSGRLNATGNALANHITGNAGSNVVDGLAGNDWLTGGGGNDFFLFDTAPNASTNFDRVLDFNVAMDTIRLENAIFTRLAVGMLADAAFHVGAAAHDVNDRIVYNSATGALLYDIDGTGAAAAVRFAILDPGLHLTRADFAVV
jgi:Ca2+-binding RTX toxin-like protein